MTSGTDARMRYATKTYTNKDWGPEHMFRFSNPAASVDEGAEDAILVTASFQQPIDLLIVQFIAFYGVQCDRAEVLTEYLQLSAFGGMSCGRLRTVDIMRNLGQKLELTSGMSE